VSGLSYESQSFSISINMLETFYGSPSHVTASHGMREKRNKARNKGLRKIIMQYVRRRGKKCRQGGMRDSEIGLDVFRLNVTDGVEESFKSDK